MSTKRPDRKSDRDRACAAVLARRYREHAPDVIKIGGDQVVVIRYVDGDYLASELERFAATGTFQPSRAGITAARRTLMRDVFDIRRESGDSATKAVERVMQVFGASEQAVLDAVYDRKRKPAHKPARKPARKRKS